MEPDDQRPIEVLRQLAAIRTAIRRRLGVFGICTVLAGGCVSLLSIVAVDWLLEMPSGLRAFGAVLFVAGSGFATLHLIVRPLQARLTLAQVAGRLEQHFGGLDDRLSSTVSFLTVPSDASPSLMRQVIANTDRVVSELPLGTALSRRPVITRVAMLAIGVGALSTISLLGGDWLSIGVRRYVRPFSGLKWPHRVEIVPLTGALRVPIGESFTLRMRVARGGDADLRGVVHLASEGQETVSLAMHREAGDQYRCTVDGVTSGAVYWFEAGDDSTHRATSRIEVVERPAVAWVIARIRSPLYSGRSGTVEYDLTKGPASAVVGSRAEIVVRATKPIRAAPEGGPEAWLVPDSADLGGERIALVRAENRPRVLVGELTVTRDMKFRVKLVDRSGFVNRGRGAYAIVTAPDSVPEVAVTEPKAVAETTPRGSVMLHVTAKDDFGITGLRLVGEVVGSERRFEVPLLDAAEVRTSATGVVASVEHVWDIASLSVAPPSVISCVVEATDNRRGDETTGQVGTSGTMRLRVVGEAAFEARVRDVFVLLQRRIRRELLEQQTIRDECTDIARGGPSESSLSPRERESLMSLIRRQQAAARTLADLSLRFARLARTIQRNGLTEDVSLDLARRSGEELTSVARGPMAEAARLLQQRIDAPTRSDGAASLSAAGSRQETAVLALRALLRRMDVWGDFQAFVNKTRDLMDRQQRLRADTAAVARRTFGKRHEALTGAEQSELRRLAHKQRELAAEFDALRKRLRGAVAQSSSGGRAQTASIESALRAARTGDVFERMGHAAAAIDDNRLAGAGGDQEGASRALAKMLGQLEDREVRRLAELAKRLERADRAVLELVEQQETLAATTAEAATMQASREVFSEQSLEQARLRRNADALGRDLSEADETAEAGDGVRQAARAMKQAESSLADGLGRGAMDPQASAVSELRSAAELLAEQLRRAAHAASQKMIAAARVRLEEIREEQLSINKGTAQAVDVVASRGRLDRRSARGVGKLASAQTTTAEALDSVREDLTGAAVYNRVLERAAVDMRSSADALRGRRIDGELVGVQVRIARRLQQLIRALSAAASLPPSDAFVDALGGGGKGSSQGRPGIPTAAELIMLKTMQSELLSETIELDSSRAPGASPTEADLRAAAALGLQQREVRELMELVVREAKKEH